MIFWNWRNPGTLVRRFEAQTERLPHVQHHHYGALVLGDLEGLLHHLFHPSGPTGRDLEIEVVEDLQLPLEPEGARHPHGDLLYHGPLELEVPHHVVDQARARGGEQELTRRWSIIGPEAPMRTVGDDLVSPDQRG